MGDTIGIMFYSSAWRRPLGPQTQPRMRAHNIVCLHTIVGPGTAAWATFAPGGYDGVESHLMVDGPWRGGADGRVEQFQDMTHTADANLDGKWDVLSIETADDGTPEDTPWSDAQCESLARVLSEICDAAFHKDCPADWACHREGIPLALIPDTLPGRRGVGFHRQGVPRGAWSEGGGWLVRGGVQWSQAQGKTCPGGARIDQIPGIIARAIDIRDGDDMPTLDEIRSIVREEVNGPLRQREHDVTREVAARDTRRAEEAAQDAVAAAGRILVVQVDDVPDTEGSHLFALSVRHARHILPDEFPALSWGRAVMAGVAPWATVAAWAQHFDLPFPALRHES